jgi:hypothetical protein
VDHDLHARHRRPTELCRERARRGLPRPRR